MLLSLTSAVSTARLPSNADQVDAEPVSKSVTQVRAINRHNLTGVKHADTAPVYFLGAKARPTMRLALGHELAVSATSRCTEEQSSCIGVEKVQAFLALCICTS